MERGIKMAQKKPQLVMIRKKLDNLPPIDLPEGYWARSMRKGYGKYWTEIIQKSFKNESTFQKDISEHDYYKPERVLFIENAEKPVATATAWYREEWGQNTGYLHMVGVLPDHTGRGLGLQVSLAALHQMKKEGFDKAVLETDDFRIPAIVTYLKLDFKPKIIHENQYKRWEKIKNEINRNDLEINVKN